MNRLQIHEIVRPIIGPSFSQKMADLFLRRDSGHIGPDMYQHHAATCGNETMSGVMTWAAHEKAGTLPRIGKQAFLQAIHAVIDEIGTGLPVVEFGPGSMEDAQTLINATMTQEYVPVDCSLELIRQARNLVPFTNNCIVRPAILDFLSDHQCTLAERPALGVLLGLTLGNLPGPAQPSEPREGLVQGLKNLSGCFVEGGYLLVSIDTCQDGAKNIERYNEEAHRKFSVNHLYRMAVELPTNGFDPDGFVYEPVWMEQSGLLAHMIKATKDQSFTMGDGAQVSVKQGDYFHCDNSYKFHPAFFESCVREAGLAVAERWCNTETTNLYLLTVPPLGQKATRRRSVFMAPMQASIHAASCLASLQSQVRNALA